MRHRLAVLVLVIVCALVLTASRRRPLGHQRTPEIQKLLATANALLTRGEYSAARALYSKGLSSVPADNRYHRASLFIGLGACDAQTQQYQAALDAYSKADKLAKEGSLAEHRIIIAANRASVYRKMGYLAPALASLEAVRRPLAIHSNPLYIAQAASLLRNLDFPRSLPLFRRAILSASTQGDDSTAASAWLQMGSGYAVNGDLEAAERAITEAFRLRVMLGNKQRQSCYFFLGHLRRLQKRPKEAITLLTVAKELAGSEGAHTPLPWVYHQLGKAYLDAGDYPKALQHFEYAVRTARELRLQLLPADVFRTSAEATLQEIFEDYVSAGMEYYDRMRDPLLARRMLDVAEESRIALFEHSLNESRTLPPSYWELLAKYQQKLAASLSDSSTSAAIESAAQLRLELTEAEARLGVETEQRNFSHQILENPLPSAALASVQTKLKANEVFLSFHSGTQRSYVWAVTRQSVEVHRLPARRVLEAEVKRYRDGLIRRDRSAAEIGHRVSEALFGSLSAAVFAKEEWVLSPDASIFGLPVAALPVARPGGGAYLGERHSIRTVPGARIRELGTRTDWTGRFAGVGDAIYNASDPRWMNPSVSSSALQLARVPGTGREVRACARAWKRDPTPQVITGAAVSNQAVRKLLSERPSVFHVAGHVVPHPKWPEQVLVTLGLRPSGTLDVLGPWEIVSARLSASLVTLSGCGSGTGEALPGLGLFGLSRAWLLAGADTVVASYWPIADDSGELLSVMYEELSKSTGPLTGSAVATSLRQAQQRMRRLGGWRADPAYWAAFAVFGKD